MFEIYRLRKKLYRKYKLLIKNAMTHISPNITLVFQGDAERKKILGMIDQIAKKYDMGYEEYPSSFITLDNKSIIRLVPMEVI